MKIIRKLTPEHRKEVEKLHWVANTLARKQSNSKHLGNATSYEDLRQIAYRGICAAVYDWDPNGGKSISSYAYDRAFSYIGHYMGDKSRLIKVPRKMQKLYYKYVEIKETDSDLTDVEIAKILNCELQELANVQKVSTSTPFPLYTDTLEVDMENDLQYKDMQYTSLKTKAIKYLAEQLTDKQMSKLFKLLDNALKNKKEIKEYTALLDKIREDLSQMGINVDDLTTQ